MNPHKCHHYAEVLNPQHYLMGNVSVGSHSYIEIEVEPDTHKFMSRFVKGGDRMEVNSGQYHSLRKLGWNNKDMRGLDLT
jgi:hypothetical protein